MCGITGYISFNNKFSKEDLQLMTDAIAHRGPDADGFFVEGSLGLGHRRLSIIDLSQSANQPMVSGDGRYVIVFNGEVYNFREVAAELKQVKPQLNFKTTSDTEVILEAFAHWGETFVNKLNGMFAFAIYDKQQKELFVYRDRMGIKPIYYYWDKENFVFASELKSLKQLKHKIDFKMNSLAINEFLHLGYIPEPHSIYEHIKKFPSGSYFKITGNELTISKYWKVEEKITANTQNNYTIAKQTLKELIESSVNYRMISDVPFGTFLSGGVDSSLVTAVAQKFSDIPINTFSIGFKEAKHNESAFAKNVAVYLKTNHREFIVTERDAIDLVDKLQTIYDEPYADSSAVPTLLVSKLAREHVKMTFSGDGGDELFMGYGAYQWAKRLSNPLVTAFRKPAAFALSQLNSRYKRVGELLRYEREEIKKSHIFSQEQAMFSRQEIKALLNADVYKDIVLNEHFSGLNRTLLPEEEQALFDINYYLKDDLLVKVDRASMHHSLETRVPLLDYRIVEFAINLSPDLKIKNGEQKYLLKQVLYDYVPKEFFNRPKSGFSIPLVNWLRGDLRFLIEEYLSEKTIRKHNIVKYENVFALKKQFLQNDVDCLYNRLWLLIVLHQWLEGEVQS
jgi:asparagine synthase (glutamine-hydrolysing)